MWKKKKKKNLLSFMADSDKKKRERGRKKWKVRFSAHGSKESTVATVKTRGEENYYPFFSLLFKLINV